MDKKNRLKKKIGILLCFTGAILLLSGGYIILGQNADIPDKKTTASVATDTEELVTEDSSSMEQTTVKKDTIIEDGDSLEEEKDSKAMQDSEQNTKGQKSAHEINPDVYEWPCGKENFAYMDEPEDVIYFAKNKELFDEIVTQFAQYEGKDVLFTVGMIDGELLEANNGEVEVKEYDLECIRDLLQDEYIKAVHVSDICVVFAIRDNDFNNLIYSFNDDISPFSKANIAPHWWWNMGVEE